VPKKLVLCLDGTNNQYKKDNTNVVKLLAMLDKSAADQLVYYQPGIGTRLPPGVYGRLRTWLLTRADLAFASLLKHQVQDAYRFLMRYFEDGDEVYIFGFSRGAYTARVLAGMLHKVGLLAKGNEEMIPFAWDAYRPLRNFELAHGFRNTFGRKLNVRFLGLWDTVSSVRWAGREVSLPHTQSNPGVMMVRHAIAIDERRAYFRQNLWDATPPAGQDVREVWFAGVHCDVGGGYLESESGLSKIALRWMVVQVQSLLAFHGPSVERMLPVASGPSCSAPSATATMHESLQGWWRVVEWLPRRWKNPAKNFSPSWILPLGRRRWMPAGACVHSSVVERMNGGPGGGYTPPLPPNFRIEP